MDENVMRELKKIELDMLKTLDSICCANGIQYFLVGGTCLGAVRHKGFIPWDDDIDVGMSRKDYEKFCEVAKTQLPSDLFLQNYHTEPNCGLIFAKIRKNNTTLSEVYSHHIDMNQGIWIDIFVYDNVPDDEATRKKLYKKVLFYKNLYIIKCGYKNPHPESLSYRLAYAICKVVVLPFSKKFFIQKLDTLMQSYNSKDCKRSFPYGGAYPDRDTMDNRLFKDLTKLEFENEHFYAFKEYDTYLSSVYGNYMELPPVEKRVGGMHNIYEVNVDK